MQNSAEAQSSKNGRHRATAGLDRPRLRGVTALGDAGFTLIELLVSLALLAALLVIVPSTIRLAARASATSAELMAGADNSAALGFVQQSLAEAMPIIDRDSEGALLMAFRGDARSMSFVAPLVNGPAGGGLYRMRLEIVEGDGVEGTALQLALSAYQHNEAQRAEVAVLDRRRLATGLEAGEFRYYGLSAARGERDWSTAWASNDRLPELIEIVLTPQNPNAAPPVAMRIEPRLRRRD